MECLYNTHSDNIAGYCHNPKHPYAMTWGQIKCKNCLGKQCKHFEKEESHQIWHQKEVKKQKRKKRKERLNNYVNSIKGQN
jgi:hypothetical protein